MRLLGLLTIVWAGQMWWHFLEYEGCTSLAGLRLGRDGKIKNTAEHSRTMTRAPNHSLKDAHQLPWCFQFPRTWCDGDSIKTGWQGRGRTELEWNSWGALNLLFWSCKFITPLYSEVICQIMSDNLACGSEIAANGLKKKKSGLKELLYEMILCCLFNEPSIRIIPERCGCV